MDDILIYDYTNLAWVVNGKYQKCNHFNCSVWTIEYKGRCYGTVHQGEAVDPAAEVH